MEQQQFQSLVLELFRSLQTDMVAMKEDMRAMKTDMDRQFTKVREDIRDVHVEVKGQGKQLEEIYQARDKVKITFGLQWGLASLLIAIGASAITQIFG